MRSFRAMLSKTTVRTCVTAALSAGAFLAVAPAAHAEWYFTERGAQKMTRDAVHAEYGYNRSTLAVSCRPKDMAEADPAYKYHRWVCAWGAPAMDRCEGGEDAIFGQLIIAGHTGAGSYGYKVQRGATCQEL
jgi:hypothetical protein